MKRTPPDASPPDAAPARSPAEARLSQRLSTAPPRISTLPPDAIEDDDEGIVRAWATIIDDVDYLAMLHLPADGPLEDDAIRRAFHGFALAFHPDRWRDADDDVRAAANLVFCRGGEAYRVLQDPLLRRRYLRLRAGGRLRMTPEEIAQSERPDANASIESLARSTQAATYAKRADELLAQGNLRQARFQVQLALAKDPGNARLEERFGELDEQVKALGPQKR